MFKKDDGLTRLVSARVDEDFVSAKASRTDAFLRTLIADLQLADTSIGQRQE